MIGINIDFHFISLAWIWCLAKCLQMPDENETMSCILFFVFLFWVWFQCLSKLSLSCNKFPSILCTKKIFILFIQNIWKIKKSFSNIFVCFLCEFFNASLCMKDKLLKKQIIECLNFQRILHVRVSTHLYLFWILFENIFCQENSSKLNVFLKAKRCILFKNFLL